MAREHANIRIDMIGDADWRTLSVQAQWLYKLLLIHPKTNRAGVSDWRPNRLASLAAGVTAAEVREYAAELERGHFVVIDEDNEEILVRTYVKHDGVMKQPNMAVTMANDWTGVASERIRAVIAFEVQKLRRERPDLPGWKSERHLETILAAPTLDVRNDPRVNPSTDPSVKGERYPSVEGPPTTTATTTATPLLSEGGAPSAPSPFCKRHPEGTDLPCRGCKVAWTQYEKWASDDGPVVHEHKWLRDGTCISCTALEEDQL